MKMLLAAGLVCAALASIGSAVSMQWKSELGRVLLAPGATAPTFETRCEQNAKASMPDEDCSNEALALWLASWFEQLSADALENVLLQADPDGTLGLTADELRKLDHEGLVSLLEGQTEETLAALCETKADAKPCGTAAVTGHCKSGSTCTTATCTNADGGVKSCTSKGTAVKNPLYVGCPNFTWTSYYCESGCPIPAWAMVLGALAASGFLLLGRRTFLVR